MSRIEKGNIVNNLKILQQTVNNKHGKRQFLCECLLCGNDKIILATHINTQRATSCGCDHYQKISEAKKTHGKAFSSEYNSWQHMKRRCTNENYHAYHRYGARGIKVCDRWLNSFENFYADMGDKPTPEHQLDRIDNDGNYEPNNCRWVTPKENSNNRGKQKNKVGYTGVSYRKNRYEVSFTVNRKHKYVGVFKTLEEAVNARKNAIINYNKNNNTNLKYEEFIK